MRKIGFWILSLVLLVTCASKTGPEERFSDSEKLNAPTLNVSFRDAENYSFAVVGDLHIGNSDTTRFRKILTAAKAEGDSFIVLLGDVVDDGKRSDMEAVGQAISETGWDGKVCFVIGNHDIIADGWTQWKELNGPSHYSLTIANAKFIALDTADATLGESQRRWLQSEIKKDRPTHLFWISHYLPVIPGQRTYLKLSDELEAARLMKLAITNKTTAWFGAHYHSYIVDSIEGVTYIVAGGGGGRRMEPVLDFFFVQVQVAGGSLSFKAKVVE